MKEIRATSDELERLVHALLEIRSDALALEAAFAEAIREVAPEHRDSARNLVHYISVRRHDIRGLQADLASLGLSSLGRLEAHTIATLDAVLGALGQMGERDVEIPAPAHPPVGFRAGPALLAEHAEALLGPVPAGRPVRVMVTMPSEAASDPALVRRLLEAGMDVMRINCAHDDADAWTAMVANLRRAERAVGRACRVLVDLAGPKLRTGAVATADRVVKYRPRRDRRGGVTAPARLWLTPRERPQPAPPRIDATLPLDGDLLVAAAVGDRVDIADCRGRTRAAIAVEVHGGSLVAEARHTTYVADGAPVALRRAGTVVARGVVDGLAAVPESIVLSPGDTLVLTREGEPGRAALRDGAGTVVEPARIPCTLEAAFGRVRPGESVWFDDGRIGGVVSAAGDERIEVRVTHAAPGGSRLRAEKGINLPDTTLQTSALTAKDVSDLATVVRFADMIGLSFVRRAEDIHALEDRLHALDAGHLGIVLKIENRRAFERLPRLLLAGLRSPPVGVMVARGDLAVEVGFERLAEVQEEILWMCEAAHVPVVWATQVLESLAKSGIPSRAEVTDAAMSGRAECVMLNKGPYMVETVEFLSGVLERMQAHQSKKSAMLRKLSVSSMD